MAILICGKDDLSSSGSNISGNEKKCQLKYPASGKMAQRGTQVTQNAGNIGSLATEEDPMQMAGFLMHGMNRPAHPAFPVLWPLLLPEPYYLSLEDNGCVYWQFPGQNLLIIHFCITDRRVFSFHNNWKSLFVFLKKCPKTVSLISWMLNSWHKLHICESEMWRGEEKIS